MEEPVVDHHTRFQAAVDVIHNLPKNGSYRPSYEVMLRFYSLYKQAVCGPCTISRPGFWDPVGRYKWDAWSRLGQMSSERAMAAYVDEMKKVAQEVIDSVPMNEKTASMFHHFEPLYHVIHDMPRPPESLLQLREGGGLEKDTVDEESITDSVPQVEPSSGVVCTADSGVSEPLVLTSDSESEIFCDTLDSMEQLELKVPVLNGFHKNHQGPAGGRAEGRQVGAGQGGEGASDGQGPHRSRDGGREASHWRERGVPQGGVRRGAPGGGGGGSGRGGGGSDSAPWRAHEAQLQQQIVLALQRLREDMRSVVQRLELLERLAATHALGSEHTPAWTCPVCASREEKWWPFDVSAPTLLLFLLWPLVTQGLLYLLRRGQRRRSISS